MEGKMIKKDKIVGKILGIVLFACSALLFVSILLGLGLGLIISDAYGFSSLLIPAFLIMAGIFCFSEIWSVKRAAILLVSIIPFYTVAWGESVCRKLYATEPGSIGGLKIFSIMFLSILCAVAEYLLAIVIAGKLWSSKKSKPAEKVDDFDKVEPEVILEEEPEVQLETDGLTAEEKVIADQIDAQIKDDNEDWNLLDAIKDSKKKMQEFEIDENSEDALWSINEKEEIPEDKVETVEENIEKAKSHWWSKKTEPEENQNEYSVMDDPLSEDDFTPWEAAEGDNTVLDFNVAPPQIESEINQPEIDEQNQEEFSEDIPEEKISENNTGVAKLPTGINEIFNLMDNDARKEVASGESKISEDDYQQSELEAFEDEDENFIDDSDIDLDDEDNSDDDFLEQEEIPAPKSKVDDLVGIANSIVKAPDLEKDQPAAKKPAPGAAYEIPIDLLTSYGEDKYWIIDEETKKAGQDLKETLAEFSIEAEVTGIQKGPVVTMFEILPAPGVKLSKIVSLQDNLALRLAASSIRIVAPIPGKSAVGIEVPNKKRSIVSIRECLEQDRPEWKKMAVPVVLGKDIQGQNQIMDLVKTPHLLIAGSTGSGKSVCVNSMILSILYKRSPRDVKMILIDPKIVELKLYNDIPHLLTPVITEPKKAMQSLQYCLCEMERRYALLDGVGVRDISSYNKRIVERKIAAEKLPYIVVIIDEFADLMATTGKELETVVARLAAMSRAVGIHLVLATQRPSVDVITGLIKANIPSRVAFMVAAKMDSRIIIDQVGAEKLLGKGDMLYASSTDPFPVRIQGTFVSDSEVEAVVEAVKAWGAPDYIDDEIFVPEDEDGEDNGMSLFSDGEDPLYDKALEVVMQAGKASTSYVQRRLKIGYNRAARLVEEMESRGIVGPANGSKPREIIHVPN